MQLRGHAQAAVARLLIIACHRHTTGTLQDGTEKAQKVFVSVPTEVGQTEAEEIGAWGWEQVKGRLRLALGRRMGNVDGSGMTIRMRQALGAAQDMVAQMREVLPDWWM